MKLSIRNVAEGIGVLSIVASLVFVGMQLEQTQQIALAQQYQSRAQLTVDNQMNLMNNDHFLSASAKIEDGKTIFDLAPSEKLAYDKANLIELIISDNEYYQYRLGYISDQFWSGKRNRIKNELRNSYVRNFYLNSGSSEPIILLLNELIDEIESE